jgi:hypothetical protein
MRYIVVIVLALSGCSWFTPGPAKEISELPHVGKGLGRIAGDLTDARGHVGRAVPHTDEVGQAELGGAVVAIDDGSDQVREAEAHLQAAVAQVAALSAERDQVKTERDQVKADRDRLQADFWSHRQRVLMRWIVAGLIAAIAAIAVLGYLTKGLFIVKLAKWIFGASAQPLLGGSPP